jgi:Fic family protein
MRTYERTHPWITFSLKELHRSPSPEAWGLLGECQSKCEHIAGVPLLPSVAKRLHLLYLIKGIKGTTAIEGNTLSEDEIHRFLEGKLDLPPSREYLKQEVENVVNGCRFVWDQLASGNALALNADTLKHLNRIVLNRLKLDDDILPGEIRRYSVGVLRYRAAPAEDCEYLLDRLGAWLSGSDFTAPPTLTVAGAIVKAIIAHLYFAWIHPFGDGNGRTARLLEFYILLTSGVPTPVAHLLSNHYNLTRAEYYRQLDYASKSGGRITPFLQYAAQGLLDGLRSQIAEIRESQIEIMWRYYVHESFRDKKSLTDKRRRDLVLGLSNMERPVPLSKLPEVNVQTIEAYHGKGRMTLARDLAELAKMELIKKEPDGYRANKDIILAFLPDRASAGRLLPIPKDQTDA